MIITVDKAEDLVRSRLGKVHQRIQDAATKAGRAASTIKLLAASKAQTIAVIRAANNAGQRHFGENYVTEAVVKIEALADLPICWHFIGALQSNKTASVAAHFDWVQSVDRIKIARRLSMQRPVGLPPLNICVQVNLNQELQKAGVAPAEALSLCDEIARLPKLQLRGLMAIPAADLSAQAQCQAFQALTQLHTIIHKQLQLIDFDTISVGMSADFEEAIAAGSTLVRVGTGIFGQRLS